MRILLADADQTLCLKLESESFILEGTTDALETQEYLRSLPFDAALIVCPLADMVPARFIHDLRRDKIATPIIVQGQFDAIERIKLLTVGADDVISHDLMADEVVARLRAVIRRATGNAASIVTVGAVSVDLTEKTGWVGDIPLKLTGKEYALLEMLMLRSGTTVTKDMVLSNLYASEDEPEAIKILDVFVCKVRKKLAAAGVTDFLQTIWGRGFMIGTPASMGSELRDLVDSPPWTIGQGGGLCAHDQAKMLRSPPLQPALGEVA